eukprot:jgi/Botrbrau1/20366/Bobra.0006s0031.1
MRFGRALQQPLELSRRCHSSRYGSPSISYIFPSQRTFHEKFERRYRANASSSRSAGSTSKVDDQRITIFYKSGWSEVILHGSVEGSEWQDYELYKVRDDLWAVDINLQNGKSSTNPPLEFVLKNGLGTDWDKSPDGANYIVTEQGSHILFDGRLHPTTGERFMLVSDLDDTMIGDDEATKAFKTYWERGPALLGGKLVYNTGRHLGKYEALYGEKWACMARPDVLICSVGTEVYEWDGAKKAFRPDKAWVGCLDAGWDYEVVKETMMQLVSKVNDPSRLRFNAPDEQNAHKCTCMVALEILLEIQDKVEKQLGSAGVQYKFIASGKGAHRFVDIIPEAAGKLPALEYVRKKYGFEASHVIACGDSGNDKDMLAGDNLAIVVGNAHDELKEWAEGIYEDQVKRNGTRPRMYLADKTRAYGILEGLEVFGFKRCG